MGLDVNESSSYSAAEWRGDDSRSDCAVRQRAQSCLRIDYDEDSARRAHQNRATTTISREKKRRPPSAGTHPLIHAVVRERSRLPPIGQFSTSTALPRDGKPAAASSCQYTMPSDISLDEENKLRPMTVRSLARHAARMSTSKSSMGSGSGTLPGSGFEASMTVDWNMLSISQMQHLDRSLLDVTAGSSPSLQCHWESDVGSEHSTPRFNNGLVESAASSVLSLPVGSPRFHLGPSKGSSVLAKQWESADSLQDSLAGKSDSMTAMSSKFLGRSPRQAMEEQQRSRLLPAESIVTETSMSTMESLTPEAHPGMDDSPQLSGASSVLTLDSCPDLNDEDDVPARHLSHFDPTAVRTSRSRTRLQQVEELIQRLAEYCAQLQSPQYSQSTASHLQTQGREKEVVMSSYSNSPTVTSSQPSSTFTVITSLKETTAKTEASQNEVSEVSLTTMSAGTNLNQGGEVASQVFGSSSSLDQGSMTQTQTIARESQVLDDDEFIPPLFTVEPFSGHLHKGELNPASSSSTLADDAGDSTSLISAEHSEDETPQPIPTANVEPFLEGGTKADTPLDDVDIVELKVAQYHGISPVHLAWVRAPDRELHTNLLQSELDWVYNPFIHNISAEIEQQLDHNMEEQRNIEDVFVELRKVIPPLHTQYDQDKHVYQAPSSKALQSTSLFGSAHILHDDGVAVADSLKQATEPPWQGSDFSEWLKNFGKHGGFHIGMEKAAESADSSSRTPPMSGHDKRRFSSWKQWWKETVSAEDYFRYLTQRDTDFLHSTFHLYESDPEDEDDTVPVINHMRGQSWLPRTKEQEEGTWSLPQDFADGLARSDDDEDEEDGELVDREIDYGKTMELDEEEERAKTKTSTVSAAQHRLKLEQQWEKEARCTVQADLQSVWEQYEMPSQVLLDLNIKYCGDHLPVVALRQALHLWRSTLTKIMRREELIATWDIHPAFLPAGGAAAEQNEKVVAAKQLSGKWTKQRHVFDRALAKQQAKLTRSEVEIRNALAELKRDFGDSVNYRGVDYLERMKRDKTERLYWLHHQHRQEVISDATKERHSVPIATVNL